MYNPLPLFVAFFFLFLPNAAISEESTVPLIVVAADQSYSMHKQAHADKHIVTQTEALVMAIDQYVEQCEKVLVSYIAWGGSPSEPVNFWLHDPVSRADFAARLTDELSLVDKGLTFHRLAMESVIKHVESLAPPTTIVVFLTDEPGLSSVTDLRLPLNTILFKISLGSGYVRDYIARDFMPGVGFHYHAETVDQLSPIINDVFVAMTDVCLG